MSKRDPIGERNSSVRPDQELISTVSVRLSPQSSTTQANTGKVTDENGTHLSEAAGCRLEAAVIIVLRKKTNRGSAPVPISEMYCVNAGK